MAVQGRQAVLKLAASEEPALEPAPSSCCAVRDPHESPFIRRPSAALAYRFVLVSAGRAAVAVTSHHSRWAPGPRPGAAGTAVNTYSHRRDPFETAP